jgi:spore germination cell wall hydrolase CwlJ-like protein
VSSPLWKAYQLSLLALVIWREARGEGSQCMTAVGCAIRNRVKRPGWWGKDYISVISKKWQFSSMAAPGDPQLIRYPQTGDGSFEQAMQIAEWVINETAFNVFPGADSFFDESIPRPKWATDETYCGKIGRMEFHNVDHDYEAEHDAYP